MHAGVGVPQQAVERGNAIELGLGHAGLTMHHFETAWAQAPQFIDPLEGSFTATVLEQHGDSRNTQSLARLGDPTRAPRPTVGKRGFAPLSRSRIARMISNGFSDFGGRTWLNCSHQGALPDVAVTAVQEAIQWKQSPSEMTTERFVGVPKRLRNLLAGLIGVEADDVIPANGASYGLHLLANGLPLTAGDEVLVMAGDFPSNILPWLDLERRGVAVRQLRPRRYVLEADEIEAALTPSTRVLCMSWVHSFSGFVADLEAIGRLCRERGVIFIANTTQGLGARRLDLRSLEVDAIVNAGWKYLCGPYATGFCWMRPDLRTSLTYNQAYWQTLFTAEGLAQDELDLHPPDPADPRRFDILATANFFNYVPWSAAIELVLDRGPDRIEAHDQALVARLLDNIDRQHYDILSPTEPSERSTLVFLSAKDAGRNAEIYRTLAAAGVDIAFRAGKLRISPHFYNTESDVDRAVEGLERAANGTLDGSSSPSQGAT